MTNNRYMTPLKYKDGNGKERTTKLYFELDPIELMDWTFANPWEANELLGSLSEMAAAERDESRNLTQDEIRTALGVIRILAILSAGKPSDDGEYFHKDKHWTDSYAYREFRKFLLTNPKEMIEFQKQLLDNDVMEQFASAVKEGTEKYNAEVEAGGGTPQRGPDSGEDVRAKMEAEIRAKIERENAAKQLEQ